jgi:hypothetical protein
MAQLLVLVLVFSNAGGVTSQTVDGYTSFDSCAKAASDISKSKLVIGAFCVPKDR